MAELIIHQEKITDNQELVKICPFGAMEEKDGKLSINAACKMCRLCVKKGPEGAVEYVEDTARPSVNKEEWKGADTGSINARFAPLAFAMSHARASAVLWPAITIWVGELKLAGSTTSPCAASPQAALTSSPERPMIAAMLP